MQQLEANFKTDIEQIGRIPAVPAILEVICRTTGLGFSAVARVTPERWVTCAVKDDIQFGLLPGGELKVDTTICHEIRQSGKEVIIDHVSEDEHYRSHHTPAQYGFQSYISVPIFTNGGNFWGTLCAIDPSPALLNNSAIRNLFKLYAELIAMHLEALHNNVPDELEHLNKTTVAALQKQLAAITERTNDGVNARQMREQERKALVLTVETIVAELSELLGSLKEPA
ncbi:MAG: GAF domain-containing protein [Sphingobacteriales bacterium]|nr:MAG: GAF domain-containing protein [Sphingobacteriales bacterium]